VIGVAALLFSLGAFCQILNFGHNTRSEITLRERLQDWYFAVEMGDWTTIPLAVLRFCDDFLTSLLGKRIVSWRAIVLGAIPSTFCAILSASHFHHVGFIRWDFPYGFIVAGSAIGLIDSCLVAASRRIIRRATVGGKRNILTQLALLYPLLALPGFIVTAVSHPNVGSLIFSAIGPILLPYYWVLGRDRFGILFYLSLSLSSLLLFAMLAASYALMFSRRFTQRPLAWFLDRVEQHGDVLGILAAALLSASAGLGLLADVMEKYTGHTP
jgi:hypothetical protein